MAKTAVAHPEPDDHKCPHCGACKHCGAGGVQFVPMPYPVYPYNRPYVSPWPTSPLRPYVTWGSGSSSPNTSGNSAWSGQTYINGMPLQ